MPFAFWLVQALRPRILVELGTRHGVSYAAFCEAVRLTGLTTQCVAIDGGEGEFAPAFAELAAFHDPRYGSFSRLLRSRFDAAVAQFADGSIDLLHLDGDATLAAIRHDFENWRPKLSPRAVVLFHNINERAPGFGVWQLWAELGRRDPSFAFMHAHGLGVLAIGPALDGPARDLCHLTDSATIAAIRDRFAQSGLRCMAASATAKADAAQRSIEALTQQARSATHGVDRVALIARDGEKRAAVIRRTLEDTELDLSDTRSRLADAQARLTQNMHDLAGRDLTIAQLRHVEQAFHVVTRSTMWRVMMSVQNLLARVPKPIIGAMRQSIRAAGRLTAARRRPPPPVSLVADPPPVVLEPPPPAPTKPEGFTLDDIDLPRSGYLPLIEWFDPIAPDVSIVVYNREAGAAGLLCLQHLWQNTTGHRYEIILVDNGSAPDEIAHLQAEAPLVRVMPLGGNRYLGEACNIGAEAAQGRYVCLLDSASFVTPGWLEPLMQALDADDDTGAAGPLFRQPDGKLLESGWLIDRQARVVGLTPSASQAVDALSPSCLLLRRADFLRALGFDLIWDPGSYEMADLCLKLRLLGRRAVCCPNSVVERLGPDPDGAPAEIVTLNRAKFVERWGRSLDTMWQQTPSLLPADAPPPRVPAARPRVLIYTPYQLTPGGGERYILTMAQALKPVADVTLVTAYRVSRTRLRTMAREFELDLDHVDLTDAAALADGSHTKLPRADLAFVLGNELLPTAAAMARHNIYICQFPFPFEHEADRQARLPFWRDFEQILTYSDYVRTHVLREMEAASLPSCPVDILTPPVPMVTLRLPKRRGQILHVGRFFIGGHCKRQDAMIDAFRKLIEAGVPAELHFAGSTMPELVHQAYYTDLIDRARGLPVTFHPNCSADALRHLYAESDLYWHATGVGRDVESLPHVVEHFGISIVEAMSAGCIPVVFAAGGPATIVQDGVTGFHFHTLDELVALTRRLLEAMPDTERESLRIAAEAAAQNHTEAIFTQRVLGIAARAGGVGMLG